MSDVTIHDNSRLTELLDVRGITLGRHIFIVGDLSMTRQSLIAHELVHVMQVNQLGVFRFYTSYVWQFVKNYCRLLMNRNWEADEYGSRWTGAYRSIKYEVQARRESSKPFYRKAAKELIRRQLCENGGPAAK